MLTKTLTTPASVYPRKNRNPLAAGGFFMGGAWLEHATSWV